MANCKPRPRELRCVLRVVTSRTRALAIRTTGGHVYVPIDEARDLIDAMARALDGALHVAIGPDRCPWHDDSS